jgi:hypothetical protein
MNLTNLELDYENSTSSRIFFHCKDGLVPNDEQKAVCSGNGTWFPDLTQFECRRTKTTTIQYIATLQYTSNNLAK